MTRASQIIQRAGRLVLLVLAILLQGGCINMRFFPDPAVPQETTQRLQGLDQPLRMRVTTEFQRNGLPYSLALAEMEPHVLEVLRASRMVEPSPSAEDGVLQITINNIANLADARAAGFMVGFTLGAAGHIGADHYLMTWRMQVRGRELPPREFRHALYHTGGNVQLPQGAEVMPDVQAGFRRIVHDLVIRALREGQAAGDFAPPRISSAPRQQIRAEMARRAWTVATA